MGTNYYHKDYAGACPTCGQGAAEKHIGKSSAGWTFGLHVYPEDGINSRLDWFTRLLDGGVIEDEYGQPLSVEDFMLVIDARTGRGGMTGVELAQNHAVNGPDGLVRHQIDGRFCIGYDGKCDLLVGEFS